MPVPIAALAMAGAAAAALTGSMYLDARLGLSYDAWLMQSIARAVYSTKCAEKRGRANFFCDLEAAARDPRTRDAVFLKIPHHPAKENGNAAIRVESLSYAAVYAAVLSFALFLHRVHGVRRGHVVAIDMPNGVRFVVAWFAVWSLGATPAFINYHLKGEGLLHCVRASTARLVLVGSESDVREKYDEGGQVWRGLVDSVGSEGKPKEQRVKVVRFGLDVRDEDVLNEPGFREEDSQRKVEESQDMAILIYTSGTTGLPKPAVVSWGKARVAANFNGFWLPLKKGDVVFTAMPLYHTSASLLALLGVLTTRTTLALAPSFSTTHLLPSLHATRSTHLQYVGETLRYLLASPPNAALDTTHGVRTIFGNGLRPDVWTRFCARFNIATVCEFYAATEGPAALWNRCTGPFTAGAVGYAGALFEKLAIGDGRGRGMALVARVDSETGELVRATTTTNNNNFVVPSAPNEPGELLFRLPAADTRQTFQGYFNNEGASASKIARSVVEPGDAWFRTGDVLRADGQRRWWFADRLGDTFRWKSENVATMEVAGLLAQGKGGHVISDVAVYGVKVPGMEGRAGCAAVCLKGAEGKDARWERERLVVLADHARDCLPKYAVPVFVRVTKALSVTGTNKMQKHVLQKEGIDLDHVAKAEDRIYWLSEGRYERFGKREYDRLMGGGVKL